MHKDVCSTKYTTNLIYSNLFVHDGIQREHLKWGQIFLYVCENKKKYSQVILKFDNQVLI